VTEGASQTTGVVSACGAARITGEAISVVLVGACTAVAESCNCGGASQTTGVVSACGAARITLLAYIYSIIKISFITITYRII
jgi:hypothetical protein